ncbi:MAG: hypothetical protein RhofKO_28900 [Rhodothermales bacterium]
MLRSASLLLALLLVGCSGTPSATVTGETKLYHPLTLDFTGPQADELDEPNPFRNYRMAVTFKHDASGYEATVPGYFAADGNASETSATSGDQWRAHFTPHETGTWSYTASFRTGDDVALSLESNAGTATAFDGTTGTFEVGATDKTGRDFRSKGVLRYVGERYLRFDDGTYFLKGGPDSPENLLGYVDFDGTRSLKPVGEQRPDEAATAPLHKLEAHLSDWQAGDPTWQGGKGKALIGGLNYLASKGLNSFSFLTMNVEGDGQDVWPWVEPDVRDRFDVSKLAQWNIVFTYASELGMFLHFKTQETENDMLLDNGDLGPERRLYYRELVARFGHHHASNYNLGEEHDLWQADERNDTTQALLKSYTEYIHALDGYDRPVVVHSYPQDHDEVYGPLLGSAMDGASVQTHYNNVHASTLKWIEASAAAGKQWVVANDEQNSHLVGVKPDGPDSNRDDIRKHTLWGNLMAGGAGVEYYFGYEYPHNDLNMEDWRSRDIAWSDVNHALTFFRDHLPFWEMDSADDLVSGSRAYGFAKPGEVYAVYLLDGGTAQLDLGDASQTYTVQWYNPREGGALQNGSVTEASGPGTVNLGAAPSEASSDWAILVKAQP